MSAPEKICEDCGKVHKTRYGHTACSAHLTGSGKTIPCTKAPLKGMTVCRTHGGAIKASQVAAQQRIALMTAQGEIAELMRECDIPEQHPIDGLLEVVRVSGAMMRLLTVKVGELKEEPLVKEVLVEKGESLRTKLVADSDAFWGLNAREEMVPSIYVQLLQTWTERYERACKTALEAGIEERRIQLAEDTSETFFRALSQAVLEAGLDPVTRAALNEALARQLRTQTQIIDIS